MRTGGPGLCSQAPQSSSGSVNTGTTSRPPQAATPRRKNDCRRGRQHGLQASGKKESSMTWKMTFLSEPPAVSTAPGALATSLLGILRHGRGISVASYSGPYSYGAGDGDSRRTCREVTAQKPEDGGVGAGAGKSTL